MPGLAFWTLPTVADVQSVRQLFAAKQWTLSTLFEETAVDQGNMSLQPSQTRKILLAYTLSTFLRSPFVLGRSWANLERFRQLDRTGRQ